MVAVAFGLILRTGECQVAVKCLPSAPFLVILVQPGPTFLQGICLLVGSLFAFVIGLCMSHPLEEVLDQIMLA